MGTFFVVVAALNFAMGVALAFVSEAPLPVRQFARQVQRPLRLPFSLSWPMSLRLRRRRSQQLDGDEPVAADTTAERSAEEPAADQKLASLDRINQRLAEDDAPLIPEPPAEPDEYEENSAHASLADEDSEDPVSDSEPDSRPEDEESAVTSDEESLDKIPIAWQKLLDANSLKERKLLPAAVHVMRLCGQRWLDRLMHVEDQLRAARAKLQPPLAGQLRSELKEITEEWLQLHNDACRRLADENQQWTAEQEEVADRWKALLNDQIAAFKTTLDDLNQLDPRAEAVREPLIAVCCRLVRATHELRDTSSESLVALQPNLLSEAKRATDVSAMVANRCEAEKLLRSWRQDPQTAKKLLTLTLLRLDHFGVLNQRFGIRIADEVISAFTAMVNDLMRQERGFDRTCHLSGPSFLMLFGDTARHNAASGTDRIRQAIEATTFRYNDEQIPVTASCVVVELGREDDPTQALSRLQRLLEEALEQQRNCTYVLEGDQLEAFPAPDYEIEPRVVQVLP